MKLWTLTEIEKHFGIKKHGIRNACQKNKIKYSRLPNNKILIDEEQILKYIDGIPKIETQELTEDISCRYNLFENYREKEARVHVLKILNWIDIVDRDKRIFFDYYIIKLGTLKEVGIKYGITTERVRQINAKVIRRIRKKLKYTDNMTFEIRRRLR